MHSPDSPQPHLCLPVAEGPLWAERPLTSHCPWAGWAGAGAGAGRAFRNITYIPALYKALYLFACCWVMVELNESVPVSGLGAPVSTPYAKGETPNSERGRAILGIHP